MTVRGENMRKRGENRLYHPPVDGNLGRERGQRDSRARLRLLEGRVDFANKVVLDLGCSAGFFALSLAKRANRVIAIDANPALIAHNRAEASRLRLPNVEFIQACITPSRVATLPHVDIVLFLSVLHHILVASEIYQWNDAAAASHTEALLSAISGLGDTYIFEMGEPWEAKREWAAALSTLVPEPHEWIPQHVFRSRYERVESLPGVAFQRWPFASYPRIAKPAANTRIGRTLLRLLRISRSDFRTIYIGTAF